MKILVTGGAGFIGSHLVDKLIEEGHDVTVVDDLSTGNRNNLNNDANFYEMDIRDNDELDELFEKEQFDIVNHHAAQVSVSFSVENPDSDKEINVNGTKNIIENCKKHNVSKLIFSSSAAVYGNPTKLPINENTLTNPISPYGKHKLDAEKAIIDSGLEFTIFRYGNVYGPRQNSSSDGGAIAIFSEKLMNHEKITIFGDGNQVRDFIFVDDVVDANMLSLDNGSGEIFVIGTGIETSINDLLALMKSLVDSDIELIYAEEREDDIERSVFDIVKSKDILSFIPKTTLRDGLAETIKSYLVI